MSALSVAAAHARLRRQLAEQVRLEARAAWARVDRARISETWAAQIGRLLLVVTAAQRAAAATADSYVTDVLDAQGIDPSAEGVVAVDALSGVASDGRPLGSLLALPGITAKTALAAGRSLPYAMASGGALTELIARTQVADAGRVADQVALVAHPGAGGYVRMVVGKTCSRCLILAGRWYRYNAGFKRHTACDCIGIPSRENVADDLRTDPRKAFESMSAVEQDRVFTKAGAESIRLGADMNQVVNVRRGAAGLTPAGARLTADEARLLRGGRDVGRLQTTSVFGRDLFVTTEGTTTRGLAGRRLGANDSGVHRAGNRYRTARPPRLMPESILQIAGNDRAEATRLLRRYGYIR